MHEDDRCPQLYFVGGVPVERCCFYAGHPAEHWAPSVRVYFDADTNQVVP